MLIGSYLIFMVISRFSFKQLLPILVAVCLSVVFISYTGYSEITERWYNKTFKNERGISGATSGRADQWKMAGVYLVSESPLDILGGFGPGKAPNFSQKFSTRVNAIESMAGGSHQLHSLYLNILIEFGLVAFICFCIFLIKRFKKVFSVYTKLNYKLPLLAFFGYMLYIGSTSGLGVIPGMFIALFLLNVEDLKRKKKGIRILKKY